MLSDTNTHTIAIIVAAGAGTRMQGIDKLFYPLAGLPVLLRTVKPFQDCPFVQGIILVVSGDKEAASRNLFSGREWSKIIGICPGGVRRQDSVAAGLKLAGNPEWVIIHDGARPLVTVELIERGLSAAAETGAAVAAVPVTDTVKKADAAGFITETLRRDELWNIQTPQVFRADIIRKAYEHYSVDVTDDAALVEQLGYRVKLYTGSCDNIKITTPGDIALAEILLRRRENSA